MFRFAHPDYLYLLFLLPLMVALFFSALRIRKNNMRKFGDIRIFKSLMPESSVIRLHVRFWLFFVAVTLLIFAISQPQFGSKLETVQREGIEIMIALDVSNSMLSQDKDLPVDRLDRAKQIISKMIDNLQNDKVGLIVFAGDAYIQMPITTDFISAKMFLASISPSLVPVQGTAIGRAVNLAVNSFTSNESVGKSIIVITDGENHEDDAVKAAEDALAANIQTHVIGIGSLDGTPIPVSSDMPTTFRKDRDGNVIVSSLNEAMCQQIAHAGKGIYVRADNSNKAQKAIETELDKMDKSMFESTVYTEYDEQFPVFIWGVLFLLLVEFFVLDRKNRLFYKVKFFDMNNK
ncbi:MAG: VWA domain-containing protein [Bacteroidales bacterium]|nr:VWA domain-containing protein [Bacteroidales bacterium]